MNASRKKFPQRLKPGAFCGVMDGLNRLRKNSAPGRKDVPQGLNHEWPPHGQLFGIAYATFFTESRRHLARGAQLNRPFVAARRILNHLRHDFRGCGKTPTCP